MVTTMTVTPANARTPAAEVGALRHPPARGQPGAPRPLVLWLPPPPSRRSPLGSAVRTGAGPLLRETRALRPCALLPQEMHLLRRTINGLTVSSISAYSVR